MPELSNLVISKYFILIFIVSKIITQGKGFPRWILSNKYFGSDTSYCKSIKEIFGIELKCFSCFSLETFTNLVCACEAFNQTTIFCWKTSAGKLWANTNVRTRERCSHPQTEDRSRVIVIPFFSFKFYREGVKKIREGLAGRGLEIGVNREKEKSCGRMEDHQRSPKGHKLSVLLSLGVCGRTALRRSPLPFGLLRTARGRAAGSCAVRNAPCTTPRAGHSEPHGRTSGSTRRAVRRKCPSVARPSGGQGLVERFGRSGTAGATSTNQPQ